MYNKIFKTVINYEFSCIDNCDLDKKELKKIFYKKNL